MRWLRFGGFGFWLVTLAALASPGRLRAEGPPAARRGFDVYVETVEARLDRQHGSAQGFLVAARLGRDGWAVEDLTPAEGGGLPGALIHHWRGTAFVSGASAVEMERAMRDFAGYPRIYAPQVLTASAVAQGGDDYRVQMRVRQRHGITVTLDTSYEVTFGRLDERHGFSVARSTEIREVGSSEDQGFLWRQNTYWSWEEHEGGLLVQVESVSLTRSVPLGLGWLIGPYIGSIPRESLAFTLRATREALRAEATSPANEKAVLGGSNR